MTRDRDPRSSGEHWTEPFDIVGGQTLNVVWQPPKAVRLKNVRLSFDDPSLDITYVQVGNVMLARFSRWTPVCDPGARIAVIFANTGKQALQTAVVFEFDQVKDA